MKLPFKRKKRTYFEYIFLCKTCDIFFPDESINKNKCPICGRRANLWEVKEKPKEKE